MDRYIRLPTSVVRTTFSAKGKTNVNTEIIQLRVKFTISSLGIDEGSIKKRKRKWISD